MSLLLFLFMFFTPNILPFLFATNAWKYFCQIFEMQVTKILEKHWQKQNISCNFCLRMGSGLGISLKMNHVEGSSSC
jgi:hypothetical protein